MSTCLIAPRVIAKETNCEAEDNADNSDAESILDEDETNFCAESHDVTDFQTKIANSNLVGVWFGPDGSELRIENAHLSWHQDNSVVLGTYVHLSCDPAVTVSLHGSVSWGRVRRAGGTEPVIVGALALSATRVEIDRAGRADLRSWAWCGTASPRWLMLRRTDIAYDGNHCFSSDPIPATFTKQPVPAAVAAAMPVGPAYASFSVKVNFNICCQ